jgi:tripartite-type tricarboxylate transporter receptor subunit TctC
MPTISRRRLLQAAGAAATLAQLPRAFAQSFPSKNIRVVVPTAQGGSADRLARVFDDFWGPLLKTHFEYQFMAGAAGQVGYETFIGKRERDGHNLLFGNMGPEMIMYALQKPGYKFPQDYQYFCRLDVDDSIVFANRQSKFRKLEDVLAESKKRTVNVATSRLPHPASIGVLALGRAIGGRFNLVPYGGGNPTSVAVLNGEADIGCLPIAGVITQKETLKVLGIFNDDHKMGHVSENAPAVNKVAGSRIPALYSSRSWAVHTEVIEKHPDRFALLEKTARQVFDNPRYREEYAKTGAPVETIQFGDRALCTQYANDMIALANEYRDLLTAKRGRG